MADRLEQRGTAGMMVRVWMMRGSTFIMSTTVLRAIMTSTVYSNDGDATKCHSLYWKVCLFWGM